LAGNTKKGAGSNGLHELPQGGGKAIDFSRAHANVFEPRRASQLRYNLTMKTATLPSIRVKPELRVEIEALLNDNESLSGFVEASVRESVQRRRDQAEFMARGMASLENARRTNDYVDADVLIGQLERKLVAAKASRAAGQR